MAALSDHAYAGRLGGLARAARYSAQELTGPARAGFLGRFLREVDEQSPGLPEPERQRRANCLLKMHMIRLAQRSAKVRSQRKNKKRDNDSN